MQEKLKDVLTSAIGLAISDRLELMLFNNPSSDLERNFRRGVAWGLVDEVLDYSMFGQSMLMNGRYQDYADKVLFNTIASVAIDDSGIADNLVRTVSDVSPLPSNVNGYLLAGALKVGATEVARMIDNEWSNTPLRNLVHPTRLIFNS